MPRSSIRKSLLIQLNQQLTRREIDAGIRCLDQHQEVLKALDPNVPGAGRLVGYVAQWVDVGYGQLSLVQNMVSLFSPVSWSGLALVDYIHLRLAQGLVAMLEERLNEALDHFQFVLSLDEQISDRAVVAISSFWIGRCHRKKGQYDDALRYTIKARDVAVSAGHTEMAAVMRLLESWLAFQKGRFEEAWQILNEVEKVLATTDDYMSLGNLYSTRGRMTRRDGRYERSVEYFELAIKEYKRRNPRHRNVARALTNLASGKRLIATQLVRRIDEAAAKGEHTAGQRKRFDRLRNEAMSHLASAERIFGRWSHNHGLGNVRLVRALLALDAGELTLGSSEVEQAYVTGEKQHDLLVMARAQVVKCMIENARFEEQIEQFDDPSRYAQRAFDSGLEAVELARQTQNTRLLARAFVWVGLTLSNAFFNDINAAREYCDRAAGLLRMGGTDHSWRDYSTLRQRVVVAGEMDERLQQWSQGEIGTRTFQELSEEFAGIIIPKVWAQEGHKVSRVAKRLSVSPKKVRRILEREKLRRPSGPIA